MTDSSVLSATELADRLQGFSERYWDRHPFHIRMHEGRLSRAELRLWTANRWYYQKSLPQKDAAIVANCPVAEVRRRWLTRIIDQDGTSDGNGGTRDWLALGQAVGLAPEEVLDERHVLAGVRFATDAYVTFARTRPWIEAVAASLTELFSGDLMRRRLMALREHYPWIDPAGLAYFERRPAQADAEAAYALELVTRHCTTGPQQQAALSALSFKCDALWAMLDAVQLAAPAQSPG